MNTVYDCIKFREICPLVILMASDINTKCVLSDNTHVTDSVSLSFFKKVVVDTFVTGTHLIFTVALVHAVDFIAAFWSDWCCVWLSKDRVKNLSFLLVS